MNNDPSTKQQSSPGQLVDALHTAFGDHHSRAVHAKGIILEGDFVPDPAAKELTKAPHLQDQNSKVTIRFSDFTGIPTIPDNAGPANPRGLAIKFKQPDGSSTDIVCHSFDGFPTANSDQFRELREDGDKIQDPSIAWPQSRKKVLLGVVTITALSPNTPEEDKALSFIPNNLPDGIRTADPMLDFRSTVYPISVKGRQ